MLNHDCVRELEQSWLPNITDDGLKRIIELLPKDSPLLIHGCCSKAGPVGCLAPPFAWNHELERLHHRRGHSVGYFMSHI